MSRRALLFSLGILVLTRGSLRASGEGLGTTTAPFLKIPISGRAAALGGAFGAVDGDVAALDYNPGGLSGLTRADVQAGYISHLEGTSLQSLQIGFPIRMAGPTFEPLQGAEFPPNQLNLGFEFRQFKADDEARDFRGVKGESFDVTDQLLAAGLSYPLKPRLSVGATAKMIKSKIQNRSISNTAFDAGLLSKINSRFSFGLSVQNIGGEKAFEEEADPLPRSLRASIGITLKKVLLLADTVGGLDAAHRQSAGVEIPIGEMVRVRGGVFHIDTLEFSGGLGFLMNGPEKATGPVYRPPTQKSNAAQPVVKTSPLADQIIANSVQKMTEVYTNTSPASDQKPSLTVLPVKSNQKMAPTLNDVLNTKFSERPEFTYVSNTGALETPSTDLIVTSSMERLDDKYAISTRIIRTDDGKTVATDYAEIAVDDFYSKESLAAQPKQKLTAAAATANRILLGLDYGMTTNRDLGLTHTVTFRILY